jgi:DNA-binding SARP family transcriptional activator
MASCRLRIELLGGFRVLVDEHAVADDAWRRRKPAAVLKLLALSPGHRLHREQFVDWLWPELGRSSGGANLRKAIHHARSALDATVTGAGSCVASDGEFMGLAPDGLSIDVEEFRSLLARARRAASPQAYEDAVAIYHGELLPDDRYEEWATAPRRELTGEYVSALSELVGLQEAAGELAAAVESARQLVAADPLREESHVALMRLDTLTGRRTDAVRQYEQFAQLLDEELGTEPGPDAQRLYEEIRARQSEEPELTAGLWERVGDLRVAAGDAVGAAKAFAESLAVALDDESSARLERKCAEAWLMQHRADEAADHLAAAVDAEPDGPERARLLRARANFAWESGDIATAQQMAEAALEEASRTGSADDVAAAHEALAIVSHFQGQWREGLTSELARLASGESGVGPLARVYDIHHCIGQYHLYGDGLHDSVEMYARRILDQAEASGMVRAQAFAWCLLGESLLLQARWEESEGCLARSCELHASLGTRSGALPWQRRAELAACRGDHAEVQICLREASAIATVSAMASHMWGRIYATAAFSALGRHELDEATRAVQAAAAAAARYGDCPTCSALLNPVAAEAYGLLDDRDAAHEYANAAANVATYFTSSAWQAMAETAAAHAASADGHGDLAHEHFERAGLLYAVAGQPYWAERSSRLAGVSA